MIKIKRKVYHLNFWKQLLLVPIYCILRLWYMSLRLKMDKITQDLLLNKNQQTCIFYFWHDALFMAPLLRKFRNGRLMYGLMSASKDGAWLEALVRWFNVRAVRGSSTWRGSVALKELEENSHKTCDIIITPDGPKGPRHVCKQGSLKWVLENNFCIICLQIHTSNVWTLSSWDQFRIPLPFSYLSVKARQITLEPSMPLEDLIEKIQVNLGNY